MADEQDSSTLYTVELVLENEAAMIRFAEDIALALTKGDLVTLKGDLGAGKSTLARAIIRTIANDDFYEVPSPTFTLVEPYSINMNGKVRAVYHADLYRLNDPEELELMGFFEYFDEPDSLVIIEWASRADSILPAPQMQIAIKRLDDERREVQIITR